jgi:hypothetical protein
MSQMKCEICNRLFADDDAIKAVVLGRYAALKSQRTYAIKTPLEDCLEMVHRNCQTPQGWTEDH